MKFTDENQLLISWFKIEDETGVRIQLSLYTICSLSYTSCSLIFPCLTLIFSTDLYVTNLKKMTFFSSMRGRERERDGISLLG